MQEEEMHVIKRNGNSEIVSFDKILKRIKNIGSEAKLSINYTTLAMKVIDQLYNGIETSKLDELTAEQCASLSTQHPDYGTLASRLVISNLHKKTSSSFVQVMNNLYNFRDVNDNHVPLINNDIINIINSNKDYFENIIDYERDYLIDYFGFKTLERAYLMKKNKIILERPQHMWLRVSLGIHFKNFSLEAVKETYDLMSEKYFTHATPTLFNAATPRPQLSSCYLIGMESDSVDGIFNTLKECALISKWSGGIGLHIHNIRSSGSHIRGTNGVSNGLIPMLGVFNKTARYIDQGGKRNGSFAIYLEPHHPDIEDFLDLKKNHGDEELRARDLFYAMWISDLFMERVKSSSTWSLFCPDKCQGLCDVYGEKYKELYLKYENEKRYTKQIPARDLWIKILDAQMETGTPYLLYKDAANMKSNQKNLGTIKSSNLCVAPETKILTDKGFLEIQSLKNNIVNVWNGKEFSEVEVKQTNVNSELITINFSDGSTLTCTKYHKFYIQKDYCKINEKEDIINSKYVEVVEGENLQKDMKLIKCDYPIIDNDNHLERAYTNGFFSGDGTYNNSLMKETKCNYKSLPNKSYCKRHVNYQKDNSISEYCQGMCYNKKPIVALYHEKIRLLEYLDYTSIGKEVNNKLNVTLNVNLEEKYFVPINYSLKSKLEWFSGYCDADGSICLNKDNQSLQISSIYKEFLLNIKLLLQTCGVSSKVTKNMNERLSNLPNGKGDYQLYKSKTLWRLLVSSNELMKLLELGLSCKRLKIEKRDYQRKAIQFVKVVDIIDNGRTDKTFCFNEPKRHAGIFNGVITSNCTEILEYSDEKETAVCNLASISLTKCVVENNINPFKDVVVYTKDNCNWCVLLKALLKKKQIIYKEISVDETNRDKLVEDENGIKTLPQLFDEGKYVGGFDSVLNILRNSFDYDKLHYLSKVLTKNLNNIIDINFYPTEKTERSNLLHRPIGIGVQGLADAFIIMDIPFESETAKEINKKIFETIYHGSLEASCELAKIRETKLVKMKEGLNNNNWKYLFPDNSVCTSYMINHNLNDDFSYMIEESLNRIRPIPNEINREKYLGSYSSFEGSPISKGILQFDMWGIEPSDRYDWNKLRENIKKYGIRNSLLVAPMPTASTSQILGNNECFEPLTSNIYSRRTLAGEFILVNKYLINDLININMWNEEIKNNIILNKGSIQYIEGIPKFIKEKYKIVWEIPMKHIIDMAKDRGAFICQSQSMNLWIEDPDPKILTNMHFYSWKAGLKTGIYYLRRKPKHQPQQFTIQPENKNKKINSIINDPGECLMCSG